MSVPLAPAYEAQYQLHHLIVASPMLRRLLLPSLLTLLFVWADLPAQAQQKSRTGRGYRARTQPRSSDDVKLAPGMRLGRPLALTTDYMGRPLKPKPAKTAPAQGASSISAKTAPTPATPAKSKTATPATKSRRR